MASRIKDFKKNRQKLADLEEKLKRALADYDNLEKRILGQREALSNLAKIEILDKFIAVLDDLERAEKHLRNKGLSMAVSQFRAVLTSEGVREVKAKGEIFDPETMDCVGMVEGEKNLVINPVQKGYLLNGRVIRPAKVEVGQGKKMIS
ncbi:MAG: nucleotide exchange factor GrpE [Candidatus Pacebacteria bacterium]|nr:nucleotide exchange factor GrpE [Candidatus Paceibacterota bacterium]